jgi:iron complex outermembrane receptor protein
MSGTALQRLKNGASTFLLVAFANIVAENNAIAQAQNNDSEIETVTVTGTSIRGVAPVGVNLVSVGRAEIDSTAAQTMNQILKQVPSLSNYGGAPSYGTINPAIHNLGAASSYSTLVLVDGHRFALGGTTQTLPDAGILPTSAIERVEVLADAASSTYGSDAVAGVINLVTRTNYNGFEASIQEGEGNHITNKAATVLAGASFDHGGYIMAAGGYSYNGALPAAEFRSYEDPNQLGHGRYGGQNFDNNVCNPAGLQPGSAGSIYIGNSATTPVGTASCNTNADAGLSRTVRTNGMLKVGL